jgi:hypothetical protein
MGINNSNYCRWRRKTSPEMCKLQGHTMACPRSFSI